MTHILREQARKCAPRGRRPTLQTLNPGSLRVSSNGGRTRVPGVGPGGVRAVGTRAPALGTLPQLAVFLPVCLSAPTGGS